MDHWAPVVRYGHEGTGGLTVDTGGFATSSGRFRASAVNTVSIAHGSAGDQWADAYGEIIVLGTFTGTTSRIGVALRLVDASNYYVGYLDTTNQINLVSVVAGTPTTLITAATGGIGSAGAAFYTLKIEVQGDILRGLWGGRLLASVRDTSLTAPGYVGMYINANVAVGSTEIPRFEAAPLGASYVSAVDVQRPGPSTRVRRLR